MKHQKTLPDGIIMEIVTIFAKLITLVDNTVIPDVTKTPPDDAELMLKEFRLVHAQFGEIMEKSLRWLAEK